MEFIKFKKSICLNIVTGSFKNEHILDEPKTIINNENLLLLYLKKSSMLDFDCGKEFDSYLDYFYDKHFYLNYKKYIEYSLNNTNYFNFFNEQDRQEIYSFILLLVTQIVGFDRNIVYWSHIDLNSENSEKRYNMVLDYFDSIYESLFTVIQKNETESLALFKYFIDSDFENFGFYFNCVHNHYGKKLYDIIEQLNFKFNKTDILEAKEHLILEKKSSYLDKNKFLSYGCLLNTDFVSWLIKTQNIPLEILCYIKESFSHNTLKNDNIVEKIEQQILSIGQKNMLEEKIVVPEIIIKKNTKEVFKI